MGRLLGAFGVYVWLYRPVQLTKMRVGPAGTYVWRACECVYAYVCRGACMHVSLGKGHTWCQQRQPRQSAHDMPVARVVIRRGHVALWSVLHVA
jgi:hypothetical protein